MKNGKNIYITQLGNQYVLLDDNPLLTLSCDRRKKEGRIRAEIESIFNNLDKISFCLGYENMNVLLPRSIL